ncbi:MAG: glutathione S-transferase [Piscirickettsiaceae bacterium]|nr:MAG: glutathione S-transferase [Piscirickettsiaceae bacterium]
MNDKQRPLNSVLYSFRRCPYAMRARLAIKACGINVELREIILRDKPQDMLNLSPKGTVPVLQLANGTVIDESWDIVHWASSLQDPQQLRGDTHQINTINELISRNDNEFKTHLDHYKYADRFPEYSAEHYRTEADAFLSTLECLLSKNTYLLGPTISLADIGIFPFIRQFAHVDIDWFRQSPYPCLITWMDGFLASDLFNSIMNKYTPWSAGDDAIFL